MEDPVTYRLDALTREDCEAARQWRKLDRVRLGLRTPYLLTEEMQAQFYDDVVCSRTSGHRFWAVRDAADEMVGMAGLTDVSPENGHAEISLVVDPDKHGQGIGGAAVELILTEAFRAMRLLTVYGEVYSHNPAVGFWFRQLERWPGTGHTQLPRRKFWNGRLHDSIYFWLTADGFHPRTEHVHRFDTAEIRGVQ